LQENDKLGGKGSW